VPGNPTRFYGWAGAIEEAKWERECGNRLAAQFGSNSLELITLSDLGSANPKSA
jgi:hypothetical protein